MKKEEIIQALKASAKPNEPYSLDDEVQGAMLQYPDPRELVEPVLDIIAANPTVDFGMPGDLVHFVERFYKKGYEELLIASVQKRPTAHNIWMIRRCYNDRNNPLHGAFLNLIESIRSDSSVADEIKNAIDGFTW